MVERKKGELELTHVYVHWSGANLIQMPEMERLKELVPDVKITNLDAEADPDLVEEFGIYEAPGFVITRGDEIISRFVGVYTAEDLKDEIDANKDS